MGKAACFDFDKYVKELRHTVLVASSNYDIWWTFKNKDNRESYERILNRYVDFFKTATDAHFVAVIIPLYRLYEKAHDTYNIRWLLKYLRDAGQLSDQVGVELDSLLAKSLLLWEKVSILRNRVFGHRSRAHTTEELFKEAKINPSELKALIDLSAEILNKLSFNLMDDTYDYGADTASDAVRLLDDLRSRWPNT